MHSTWIRGLFVILVLTVGMGAVSAQPSQKYWIKFVDKQGAGEIDDSGVDPHALYRRAVRGTDAHTTYDIPVPERYIDRVREMGAEPVVISRWLNAVSAVLTPAQVQSIARLPIVLQVAPVARLQVARHAEPMREVIEPGNARAQLETMNALLPLQRGINGNGVRLGFLDSEFGGFEHPVFEKLRNEGRLIEYKNFVGVAQADRHGEAVASVAVGFLEGRLVGPAYGAEVLAATTEYAPTETNQEEDNFVAALEWMETMGADVVNASLGYTTFSVGRSYTYDDLDGDTGVTTRAVDIAVKHGMVVVNSAGNDGNCDSQRPGCWYYIGTPSDADSVISVGAVTSMGTRAGFSSHGPTADGRIKPDVAAQGTDIVVGTSGSYFFSAGTSFSSPLVAGVVAQMLQVNPNLKPIEVRDILRETASQADAPDNHLGWGVIDADAAVREAERRLNTAPEPGEVKVQVYPNPTNGDALLQVTTAETIEDARLTVFDTAGRRVETVFEGDLGLGATEFPFAAQNVAAGVYMVVLNTPDQKVQGQFVVVR